MFFFVTFLKTLVIIFLGFDQSKMYNKFFCFGSMHQILMNARMALFVSVKVAPVRTLGADMAASARETNYI